MDSFWSDKSNLELEGAEDLVAYIIRGNMFVKASAPINYDQLDQITNALFDYPNVRYVRFDTPNIEGEFPTVDEALAHLKQVIN